MGLSISKLVKNYGARRVVDDVSLSLEKGEVVGLLGPNGAGKTTTFYMIVGLERCDGGSISLDQRDITSLNISRRSLLGLGYLAQESSIFRKLTVGENILAVLEIAGVGKKERERRTDELLEEFNIKHLRDQLGASLSGGERRRVEIARTLAINPSYILLDEPFTGIDPIAVSDIQEIIRHLKGKGLGVLITDHSVRETLAIVDRAYIMHSGKILISGDADEIPKDPMAKKYYLGENFSM